MRIGNRNFDTDNHTYVVGILNVTPDSFFDGGRYLASDRALFRVEEMLEEGVDILDVGGESTRPGSLMITEDEEISRVVPIIEKIKSEFNIPLSLDTYKSKVALAGIEAGADMINDIYGLQYDNKIASVIHEKGVVCCLTHHAKTSGNESSFREEMARQLMQSVKTAKEAGIQEDKIILDPGIGFLKSPEQNLELIAHLEELKEMGYPVLLGASRKSFIGKILDLPEEERLEGTLVTTVFAVTKGCAFVRVHDIKENRRVIRMAEALCR